MLMIPPALATKSGAHSTPRAASSSATDSSASWLLAAPATTGACSASTDSGVRTPPSAHGTSTSTGATAALAGVAQRAPRRSACLRFARSMSLTTSLAPRRASSRATRIPTLPSPRTAAERPFSESEPSARSHDASTAASTHSAVNGLGSPDPPRARARPDTWRVPSAMTVMSRDEVPTSSAVM